MVSYEPKHDRYAMRTKTAVRGTRDGGQTNRVPVSVPTTTASTLCSSDCCDVGAQVPRDREQDVAYDTANAALRFRSRARFDATEGDAS